MRTRVRLVLAVLLSAWALVGVAGPAQASVTDQTGVDVSWPQCDALPVEAFAFAVVGVNGGTASTTNRCLSEQLAWAASTTTGTVPGQPRVQLYVNTANPGDVLEEFGVTSWPTSGVDPRGTVVGAAGTSPNPYGACTTTPGAWGGFSNDLACSWQYGWNRAVESVDDRLVPAAAAAGLSTAAADYVWWLDVETMNSWQEGGPDALARNAAALEGMVDFYTAEGVGTVGLYSTGYQWRQIVGATLDPGADGATPAVGRSLSGRPSWLAGAADDADAQVRCRTSAGLTGGRVVMVQYIADDLDHNRSCG